MTMVMLTIMMLAVMILLCDGDEDDSDIIMIVVIAGVRSGVDDGCGDDLILGCAAVKPKVTETMCGGGGYGLRDDADINEDDDSWRCSK